MTGPTAVLFDFSGTLFRLEEDNSWFDGMLVDDRRVDGHVQAELMRRLTAPTGRPGEQRGSASTGSSASGTGRPGEQRGSASTGAVAMGPAEYHAWVNRDLAPNLHREAYLHVLRESGLADHHAAALYQRVIDPGSWAPYPDTAAVLAGLRRAGIRTAVVSNIAFDVRPAFTAIGAAGDVDAFVLSFEVGAVKPDPAIFAAALMRLGVEPGAALMVGDSAEADGGARALGCDFLLVDPLPTAERPDALLRGLRGRGVDL